MLRCTVQSRQIQRKSDSDVFMKESSSGDLLPNERAKFGEVRLGDGKGRGDSLAIINLLIILFFFFLMRR